VAGFRSIHYFSRIFKDKVHCSPKEFRSQNAKEPLLRPVTGHRALGNNMDHDVLIIAGTIGADAPRAFWPGAGLSVAVIEKSAHPGGSCGAFRRGSVFFDQGAAMLYGFGEKGFNAHRIVVNCLEEPNDVIRHDLLYAVTFKGRRIPFWPTWTDSPLSSPRYFPQRKTTSAASMPTCSRCTHHVLVERPSYTSADQTDPKTGLA
jgi:prolycopene isomerase